MGQNPVKAIGWGGRQRRVTGDQYDFFSIEYVYDNGMRAHCAARQINGCTNRKVQQINGTKGYADAAGKLIRFAGKRNLEISITRRRRYRFTMESYQSLCAGTY